MTPTTDVIKILGGRPVLGRVRDKVELESRLRKGLPFRALERLMLAASLNREVASRVAGIPLRTFARRKGADRLTFEESDRVAQFADIFAYAVSVLGGEVSSSPSCAKAVGAATATRHATATSRLLADVRFMM